MKWNTGMETGMKTYKARNVYMGMNETIYWNRILEGTRRDQRLYAVLTTAKSLSQCKKLEKDWDLILNILRGLAKYSKNEALMIHEQIRVSSI